MNGVLAQKRVYLLGCGRRKRGARFDTEGRRPFIHTSWRDEMTVAQSIPHWTLVRIIYYAYSARLTRCKQKAAG